VIDSSCDPVLNHVDTLVPRRAFRPAVTVVNGVSVMVNDSRLTNMRETERVTARGGSIRHHPLRSRVEPAAVPI
jgi:hypothetical protein